MLIPNNSQTAKTLFELYKLVAQQTMVTSQFQLGTQIPPVPPCTLVNGCEWPSLFSIAIFMIIAV